MAWWPVSRAPPESCPGHRGCPAPFPFPPNSPFTTLCSAACPHVPSPCTSSCGAPCSKGAVAASTPPFLCFLPLFQHLLDKLVVGLPASPAGSLHRATSGQGAVPPPCTWLLLVLPKPSDSTPNPTGAAEGSWAQGSAGGGDLLVGVLRDFPACCARVPRGCRGILLSPTDRSLSVRQQRGLGALHRAGRDRCCRGDRCHRLRVERKKRIVVPKNVSFSSHKAARPMSQQLRAKTGGLEGVTQGLRAQRC